MISSIGSIAGKFRDVFAIYPVSNLTGNSIHDYYMSVMRMVHEVGFQVVTISVDNATAKRKCLTHISVL